MKTFSYQVLLVSCPQYDLIEKSRPFHTPLQSKNEPVSKLYVQSVIIYIDDKYCVEQDIDLFMENLL